jgi:hypothetical protein
MAATRTTYANILRHVYTPKLWQLQNRDRILFQLLSRDEASYAEGTQINVRLHTAGSGGVGYSSAGTLPTANNQVTNNAYANYKRIYGRLKIDGALIASTRAPSAAEVKALEFDAKNLVEDLADALAYDIWQDATGRLGGQVVALATPAAGSFRIPIAGCGIKKNQIIDISSTTGTGTDKTVATTTVTSIAVDADDATKYKVVTDTTPGDGTFDDVTYYAYRQGSRNDVIDGITSIVSATGTYLGINRATAGNEFWKAQSLANGGTNREIDLSLVQEGVDAVEINSPGTVKIAVTTHKIWNKVAKLLSADKRYSGDEMKLKGWCRALNFGDNIPVIRDKYCPANKMFLLDLDTWTIYQDSEGGFIDEDGQILRQVSGSDQFEASWRRYLQPVCHDPASNCVIADIAE